MKNNDILNHSGALLLRDIRLNGKTGDIFIDDTGIIEGIGEGVAKRFSHGADFIIDGKGSIVMPGLVNTHTHAAMTLLRGYADDMVLQDWLAQKIWPLEAHLSGKDVYHGTKLACLEMIKTGTTTFNDMYFFMENAARAVEESGIRAVLSYGFIDLGIPEKRENECRSTEKLVSFIKSLNNKRIKAAVGPHAIYTVSPEGLKWCAEYAASQKIGIHIHLSETEKEVTDCVSQYGKRPSQHLDSCGILTPSTTVAHGCWLDEEECRLLGRRNVHISHNPASNMKLATHRAMPYQHLRAAGVNVCLGTDGCASNNNLDMLEEMKTAAIFQKFYWNDPTILPAHEALEMACTNGAKALGFGTGTLTVGAPADLILVNTRTVCNTPLHNATSNLVYSCSGSSVETTICNGRVLMHEKEVLHEEEILREAADAAYNLVRRSQP
jgi:5-methylthioadenosine/S-adenosylhomocysteine deaminase